ncbi:MAG TPA: hypothetical protein VIV60_26165, partial [Polyangiaceae bacterium]
MNNPLLSVAHPLAFDQFTAEQVPSALTQLVDSAKAALAAIANEPAPVSWNNSLGALEEATDRL